MLKTMRLALIAVAMLAATSMPANAAIITYDLTYAGIFGSTGVGTGQVTIDTALINNPGFTSQDVSAFVIDFTLTISGATSGNGTFGFADFNGGLLGGFLFQTAAGPVDFSTDLASQIFDFNIFSNGTNPNAPTGVEVKAIGLLGQEDEQLLLTSFTPASVPEPATLLLLGAGVSAAIVRRRLKTRA